MNAVTEASTGLAVACLMSAAWLVGGGRAGAQRARLLLAGTVERRPALVGPAMADAA